MVTKDFIRDQGAQNLTDVTRYIPGVAIHQGEGNRDELIIRGVDSSANFFVNGFRDDVQYYRDLYNTQSIELLRGPSALTFGRGVGGGLLNRTLKEAEFRRIYEVTGQTGSYYDRRVTLDAGQAINQDFAARLNLMYEKSDTFRDFTKLERYGFNPTVTWRPTQQTKVKLSYEYYHDNRTADRGNPSQAVRIGPFQPGGPVRAAGQHRDLLRQSKLERREGRCAHRHGVRRARLPERTDREKRRRSTPTTRSSIRTSIRATARCPAR